MKLAQKNVSVFQARLLSPSEVRTEMFERGGVLPHAYQQSWYLCGDVSDEFFSRVERHEKIVHTLSVFTTPRHANFAVFVLQIRDQQLRFLLPFSSEKSLRFFEQVGCTGLFLSLGQRGGNNALLHEFLCEPEILAYLIRLYRAGSMPQGDEAMAELRWAARSMMKLSTIPSDCAGIPVTEVSLNVVLDDQPGKQQ